VKKVRIAAKGGLTMARHPTLRRATVRAAKPPAKAGWRVGKVIVVRKARTRLEELGSASRTAALFAVIYGPMAAEVFGLVDAPKRNRRTPAFAAGLVTGGAAGYVLARSRRS
jgi:hypothetical protein